MPPRRKVSARQMEILIEFAETHRDLALGRFSGGAIGNQNNRLAWDKIASKLNAVATGSTKTPGQWRRYWIEFKAKTKSKAADSRRNAATTGGGANKFVPLSDIEERVLALIDPTHRSTPALSSARITRVQRLSNESARHDDIAPHWAHDIELRRIAAEERQAAALEAIVRLIRDIRDDLQYYVRNS